MKLNLSSVRKALELLYEDKCDIYEYISVKDEVTKRNKSEPVLAYSQIPCNLEYVQSPITIQKEAGNIEQKIKLFISPNIKIKPNSKIVVTQNGVTREYKNASVPAVYSNHQEIELELTKERA
ncbi:hypothetical protein [Peptostreptococcus faecalis]|uniref:hypothetical protein n=1 Tax=Peptostreptococcus faecalis TaxID=2045015 RepID=UPI000C7DFCE4|nr:hypothetical protein [Peptostreptococcus faecalis]